MALNDRQRRFVEEYLVDLNAARAAVRAGYSARTAHVIGPENLAKPEVAEAIAEAQDARAKRTGITADRVLKRWWDLVTADPNDLVQYRRGCCRHCWGSEHRYQFTAAEFDRAHPKPTAKTDRQGGIGFDGTRDPKPDCPECFGEGTGRLHALDTRKLSPAARLLYKGARRTKDGLEIMLHDQAKALENVARHLGMFSERKEESEDTAAESARKIREATAAMDQTEGRDG